MIDMVKWLLAQAVTSKSLLVSFCGARYGETSDAVKRITWLKYMHIELRVLPVCNKAFHNNAGCTVYSGLPE